MPLINKTWTTDDLTRAFQRATGYSESIPKILGRVKKKSVFVIQDLEQWWIKSEQGKMILEELAKWIQKYGGKHYFIINANIHAYDLISKNTSIHSRCLMSVILPPLSADQIRNVIWTRHQTGGLHIVLNGKNERHLSISKVNKFLNKFHASSSGVIGLALQQWIACLTDHDENELTVNAPVKREFPEIENTEWKNLIYQIFIHHNLNRQELYDLYGDEHRNWINRALDGLKSSGLIVLNERDGFTINKEAKPYVGYWLTEAGYFK